MEEIVQTLPDPLKDRTVNSVLPPPSKEMKISDLFTESKIKRKLRKTTLEKNSNSYEIWRTYLKGAMYSFD